MPFFISYNDFIKTDSVEDFIYSLDTKTSDFLKRYDIPGASISLIENGEIKWTGAFGYADIETKKETDENTVYQVASISKSVTAIGIMILVERGKINLDDSIEEHLTIRRLLSHTSGL